MVKVTHFITELSIGGAQIALYHLLAELDRDQYDLQVVCLYNGDGAIANKIRALDIPVYDLRMHNKFRLDAFLRLYSYLRQKRPFILHTWMFHANIPGRIIGRIARVPIIISAERTMGQEHAIRLRLNRWTSRMANRVICVSQTVADYAIQQIGIPAAKISTIPNGIDPANFLHMPDQAGARRKLRLPLHVPIVAAVGRPRPVKGYSYLIEAWRQISVQFPQAHLVFLGDGPDRTQLAQMVMEYGLDASVLFLGDWDNIPHLLPAFDLFALPSLHEGMSNAALEAMTAGLPVVATAVGGTPEIVIHEQTGVLVPSANVDALAEGLLQLLADPEKAQRMGDAGAMRVRKHFLHTKTVQQTESVYKIFL